MANNQTTNDVSEKKSKILQPKRKLALNISDTSTSSTLDVSKPPKLKKSVGNDVISDKLDRLAKTTVSKDDMKQLATKKDIADVNDSLSKKNDELNDSLTQKMTAQSSKIMDTAIDTRNIAYSDGLRDGLDGTKQRVAGLEARLDNNNRSMGEISRRNDAMSADFKAIGGTLKKVTEATNNNNNFLRRALSAGFQIHTDQVTKSVANEFAKITGKSIDQFITEAVYQKLQENVNDAKQANQDANHMAKSTKESAQQIINAINVLASFINIWFIEFAIIVTATIITPGLWKILTVITTVLASILYNQTQMKGSN